MVIGPQPRCAALAQERFVKFPKEGKSGPLPHVRHRMFLQLHVLPTHVL